MAPASKKVLVLGSTGVIGRILLDTLLDAKDEFQRIGIFTSTETCAKKDGLISSFQSRGAEVLVGDLANDNDVLKAYEGFDTVLSALGRTAIERQCNLILLAEHSPSIVRFIPSEFGTDIAFNASSANEKPHQAKLKVRAFLESDAVRRLTYTYLVTGPFADLYVGSMAHEPQLGSFDVQSKHAVLLGDGDGKTALTTMADCGRALLGVLQHPEACDGKAIIVNSFVTTPHAILREFERQMNAKWSVDYTSLADLKLLEDQAWAQSNPLAALYTLRRIWTEGSTLYPQVDNEIIGLKKTDTLEVVVQAAIAKPASGFQSGDL
ncbi:Isoflavone reductase-like [Pseudocercospora fuligena]|uniref:Isoflavone reductase-like n=1 Tax=Pseudocercospora fuligena TaxID=685502 RepID=A0A8H6RJV5_9PEZI|nr:Isoflavone reductase-like [Pseudocercospora fuligena]